MSLPHNHRVPLGPDDGEAMWFNGGLGILRQRRSRPRVASRPTSFGSRKVSQRRFTRTRTRMSSLSCCRARYDSSTVMRCSRLCRGRSRSPPRHPSFVPRRSDEAKLLLFFGPAGVEGFFREVATPARWLGLPPPDEPLKDRETLVALMSRYGQTVLGPPLGPKG